MAARTRLGKARRVRFCALGIGAAFTVIAFAAGCTGPTPPTPTPTGPTGPTSPSPSRTHTATPQALPRFGRASVFAADVRRAPLHPDSRAMVTDLVRQVTSQYSGYAAFNTGDYGISAYVAEASTPAVTIAYDDCQGRGATPYGLVDGPKYFVDVPIPDDVLPAGGTDGAVSIWSPSTDRLWEFWRLSRQGDGRWQACWGGRIDTVSASTGQFPVPYGVSASGLAAAGSLVSLADAMSGNIDHAVGLVIPEPARGKANYPATRQDGTSTAADALPEGTRLRLPANLRVDTLGLSPLGTAVARAAQTHGFIVVDRGGAVGVVAETGLRASDPDNRPWAAVLGGAPNYLQLARFPWDKLQVIAPNWGRTG